MKTIRILSIASALVLFASAAHAEGIEIKTVARTAPFGQRVSASASSVSAFGADAKGTISVTAVAKTNSLPDANHNVRVELRNPDDKVVHQQTKQVNNRGTSFAFQYDMQPGEENMGIRKWSVRVIGLDRKYQRVGEAEITIKYPTRKPDFLAVSPPNMLSLEPGQTAVKTFIGGHAGKLKVEVEWVIEPLGAGAGFPVPLQFKLYKPGVNPDTGSAVKSASGESKFTMTYQISSADLAAGDKWSLSIHNPNDYGIEDCKVKVTFLQD